MRRAASSRCPTPVRYPLRRGQLWTALCLALLACAPAESDEPAPRTAAPRLLVIGWDGASFRMVDRLVEAGKLPHLAALMRRGVQATLESTAVPISSAAWTSAFSGQGPGHTGVYGFHEPVPGTYDVRLVDSRTSLAPPLWRILSAQGRASIVFGVPLTYPPEPVLGTLVSGMLSPFEADYAWPPGFAEKLRARGFEPDLETWTEVREVDFAHLDRQLQLKRSVLGELLRQDDWSLAAIVFKSLDVFSHRAYGTDFSSFVAPVYERLDAILGELLAELPPDTNVIVLSDHGFRTYASGLNLHAWLIEEGFLALSEPERVLEIDPAEPLALRERAAIHGLRRSVDWSRTRAFVQVAEGNYGAIRLNLAGREPEGQVQPETRSALLEELERRLLAWLAPDGSTPVARVLRTEELYPGPAQDRLPDLVVETREQHQVFAEEGSPRVFGAYSKELPDHDRFGIFIAAGQSFRHSELRGNLSIADVAPTALHLLGMPILEEMTGRVPEELLALDRSPEFISASELELARSLPAGRPFTARELEELRVRLSALGYGD